MRLFAIPVTRNKWAYYCHSSTPPTTRLAKMVDWSSTKWDKLGEADATSWKMKLYKKGNSIMDQIDYQEWFLKSVPVKEDLKESTEKKIHVYHPSMLTETDIQTDLGVLMRERIPYHRKYMYYSAYWVPIACTFVLVPLIPNIPLAYNLFRLYSHYKAYKGAEHIQSIMQERRFTYTADNRLDEMLSELKSAEDIVMPNGSIENDIKGVLSLADIQRIGKEFQVPGLEAELRRARIQILLGISKSSGIQ
ncbi:mitochondrial K+-H+ exchange-related-domain-containing protein [Pilobolus umbonatus]|nr:mitochondrial K+-H+ exchange-related-domain-containing protein [Pilobolus umbonatus]